LLLRLEQVDLVLKRFNIANGFLDRRLVAARLFAPAVVVVDVLCAAALLGLDLEAQLAFLLERDAVVDHFHATGFARAVLGLAVLAEVAPLPVAALVDVLFVEAHGGLSGGWACVSVYFVVGSCGGGG
jgi:hypothetical protein